MRTIGVFARVAPNVVPTGDGVIIGLVEEVPHRRKVFSEEKQRIGAFRMDPEMLNPVFNKGEVYGIDWSIMSKVETEDTFLTPHIHLDIVAKVDGVVDIIRTILFDWLPPINVPTMGDQL
jgi:hypothetical protein